MTYKRTGRILLAWGTVLFLFLPSSSWAKAGNGVGWFAPPVTLMELQPRKWVIPSETSRPEAEVRVEESEKLITRKKGPSYESDESLYESLSPDEKARIRNRSKKYESLPPEKRRELERRMDQWRELPPEDKDLMRKRHQQWQKLPSGERDRIREKLNRWDSLTPQEQDEIRRKFKRP